ncbi:MAG: hypothetical protein HOP11_13645 [Saprospiraceae bacterium]|nr:hypothetical protein [Saprospiraceae bacterium]
MANRIHAQRDTVPQQLQTPEPKFVYEDCGCKIKVNLTIHYGLYGNYGGQEVKNSDEWDKGSVTVANKNNTNGDFDAAGNEIIDNTQNPVIATVNGRNEIDLMALKIEVSGKLPDCPNDHVILDYKGNIAFWDSPTKNNKINTLSFAINTLPKTIWVEAIETSLSVRDIEIFAYINTVEPSMEQDKVRATAIWCEKFQVYYRDAANTPLSRFQLPDPKNLNVDNITMLDIVNIQNYWNPDMTRYGYGPFANHQPYLYSPKLSGGRILFQFVVLPIGITKEFNDLNIMMDISRRIESYHQHMLTSNILINDFEPLPLSIELPNDDPEDIDCPIKPGTACDALDEDANPNNTNYVFSYDSPGYVIDGYNTSNAIGIYNANFFEYCRVSFKQDIFGEIEHGSKCSDFLNWKLNFTVANTKILDPLDPYTRKNQELEIVKSGTKVITLPTFFTGRGNGDITITDLGSPTAGYFLSYDIPSDSWKVIIKLNNGISWGEFSGTKVSGVWEYNKPGYLSIKIEDNGSIPFSDNCIFGFNVCELTVDNVNEVFESN